MINLSKTKFPEAKLKKKKVLYDQFPNDLTYKTYQIP